MAPSASSEAPGPGITSTRSRGTRAWVRVSSAPSSRRVVMSPLKRLTTTPIAPPFEEPVTTPTPSGMRSSPWACSTSATRVLVEAEPLMVELVSELLALRLQVAAVLGVRGDLDRHLLDHGESETLDAGHLLRIVREDADRREAEVGEDLAPDPVFAHVCREAELEVRLDRVESGLLQLVGLELVEKADAPSLLRHVEQDAAWLA